MMKALVLWVELGLSVAGASPVEGDSVRCAPERPGQAALYSSDLRWGIPFLEMLDLYETLHRSGKRLPQRAYRDPFSGRLMLPFDAGRGGAVEITADFVATVRHHVETALARRYADAVIFSDLGHSHFFIPEEKYRREYAPIPVDQMARLYEKLFRDPDVEILYHTAEQLKTDDPQIAPEHRPHLRWRFYTRNLLGANRPGGQVFVLPALDNRANTLHAREGHYAWGAGFNISASENGCFAFNDRGRIRHFDLSLYDLTVPDAMPMRWKPGGLHGWEMPHLYVDAELEER